MKSAAEETASAAAANSTGPIDSYTVCMLGAAGVGKAALLSQFRTSECINAYDGGRGREAGESEFLYLYIAAKFPHLILECIHTITNTILFAKLTYNVHTLFLCSAHSLFTTINSQNMIICETGISFSLEVVRKMRRVYTNIMNVAF